MKILAGKPLIVLLLFLLPLTLTAQTAKRKTTKKTAPAATAKPQPTPDAATAVPPKKNERPEGSIEPAGGDGGKLNQRGNEPPPKAVVKKDPPVYFYEFTRPGFTYSRLMIEHDEAGRGKISFLKDDFGDLIMDPIELSAVTLEKIKGALTSLNFLDSNENYQHEKDFSNMGNVAITVKKDGRTRTAKYNWTENKDAKLLMDEYRRIGSEYTWKFEITVARENQPLQTPGLMDALDSYIQRSEISDPPHLVPFLTELSMDERLPLIARNHAAKLIKKIEKSKK